MKSFGKLIIWILLLMGSNFFANRKRNKNSEDGDQDC